MSVTYKEMIDMFKWQEDDTNGKLNFLRTCILSQQDQIETLRKEVKELKEKK